MLEPLLLVAASGLAREVLAAVRAQGREVVGFCDDSPALAGVLVDGVPVLGPVEAAAEHPQARVLVCAGRGAARERIVGRLTAAGVDEGRYATYVHPSAQVAPGCTVGAGAILLAGVVATAAVTLGRHVVAMPNVVLTHDDLVEDYATLCAGVVLGGGVVVRRGAYLGMASSVREGTVVGAGATLGMGAALVRDLPDGETWAGVPASALTPRPTDSLEATNR